MAPKVGTVPVMRISGLPLGSIGTKWIWMWPREEIKIILQGGRWWLPPSLGRGESYESEVARGSL
jgi:hypothetical protein